jgi:hypothetical protein
MAKTIVDYMTATKGEVVLAYVELQERMLQQAVSDGTFNSAEFKRAFSNVSQIIIDIVKEME